MTLLQLQRLQRRNGHDLSAGKDMEGVGRRLLAGTIPKFGWAD
jgi:hypothetical protein